MKKHQIDFPNFDKAVVLSRTEMKSVIGGRLMPPRCAESGHEVNPGYCGSCCSQKPCRITRVTEGGPEHTFCR